MRLNTKPGFTDQVTQDLSYIEEVLEIHEMHNRFYLFLKIGIRLVNNNNNNNNGTISSVCDIKLMFHLNRCHYSF